MLSAPENLLRAYHSAYAAQLPEFEEWSQGILDRKPDLVDDMASYLYEDRYKNRMSFEDFEEGAGMNVWRNEQPSWIKVVGTKLADRTTGLAAGMLNTVNTTADWLERHIPLGGITWGGKEGFEFKHGEEMAAHKTTLESAEEGLRESAFGYADKTSWDDFLESPATKFLPFVAEHGLASLPDMVGAVVNLPAYVMARTGQAGQERAENDLRDDATVKDLLTALPFETAAAALERFGARKVFGLTDELKDTTLKEIAKTTGRRAAIESATEAIQEPIQQVGTGVATERWKDMSSAEIAAELGSASAQGAVVGLGFGGGIAGVQTSVQAARGRKPEDVIVEAVEETLGQETPAPTEPTAAPADAERTMESLTLEEEAKLGKRRKINPLDLAEGDQVTVDPMTGPTEVGTVASVTEAGGQKMVRIVDEGGSPIAVIRSDQPAAVNLYNAPVSKEQAKADEAQVKEEEARAKTEDELQTHMVEMGRIIKRVSNNFDDTNSVEQLRKMRNSPDFQQLPEESRNSLDDLLMQIKQHEVGQAEAKKTGAEEEAQPTRSPIYSEQPAASLQTGTEDVVETSRGKAFDFQWAVIAAEELVASTNTSGFPNTEYPQALQPRDRSSKESIAQMQKIKAKVNPAKLGDTGQADAGAVIVRQDGVILSGNGRGAGIKEAYEADNEGSQKYREWIAKKAKNYDISEEALQAAGDNPVMVRVLNEETIDEADLKQFVKDANNPEVLRMSPSEQAVSDSEVITPEMMASYEPDASGSPDSASNEKFMLDFAKALGAGAAGMRTKQDKWTRDMVDRVKSAIFHKAYGDDRLIEAVSEDPGPARKNVLSALQQAAPAFARARDIDPEFGGLDVPGALTDAVEIISSAADADLTVEETIAQTDIFGDSPVSNKDAVRLAKFIDENRRSGKALREEFVSMASRLESALRIRTNENMFPEDIPELSMDTMLGVKAALQEKLAEEKKKAQKSSEGLGLDTPVQKQKPKGSGTDIPVSAGGGLFSSKNQPQKKPKPKDKPKAQTGGAKESRTKVEHEFVDEQVKAAKELDQEATAELEAELTKIAATLVPGVKVRVSPELQDEVSGKFTATETERIIEVAVRGDPRQTLRHEVIHAFKEAGLFTDGEWEALSDAATEGKWIRKHKIDSRYPDLSAEEQIEEAIADEFADYTDGKSVTRPKAKQLFDRIAEFFRQLTQSLRGRGVTPAPGNIFDSIESGEIGARARRSRKAGTVKEQRAGKPQFTNAETEERWQEASKGVDDKNSLAGKVTEALGQEWRRLTRTREHIPSEAKFADVLEKMVHLEQAEHSSKEYIAGLFKQVMGDLNADDVDMLTRKMVLDDLLWTSELGMALPFGLKGTEEVLEALQNVEAVLATRKDLQDRLAIRTKALDTMRNRMVSSGVLTEKQARNPSYFRHQVLEYAALRDHASRGRAGKVRSTYWHSRRGSEKDINANYFQAESDWLYKAQQDIATAEFLGWLRTSKYNRKAELVGKAKKHNDTTLRDLFAAEMNDLLGEGNTSTAIQAAQSVQAAMRGGDEAVKSQYQKAHKLQAYNEHRRKIAVAMSMLRKSIGDLPQETIMRAPQHLRAQLNTLAGGKGNKGLNDDSQSAPIWNALRWLADANIEGVSNHAVGALAAVGRRKRWVEQTIKADYVNPQNMGEVIKSFAEADGVSAWQADSADGKQRAVHIFTGKTVTEHVLDRAIDYMDKIVGDTVTKNDVELIRSMLANTQDARMVGGPMEEMVVDDRISDTLNEFYDGEITSVIDALAVQVTGRWKQWTLFNPLRFAKYYLNNITGDTDALLATKAGKPVAKKLPQAFKEIKQLIAGKAPSEISESLAEAMEKGVVMSSLVMQEVRAMGPLSEDSFRLKATENVGIKTARKYFEWAQNTARLRESAFRYAAYLHYKDQFAAGKSMLDMGYGASPPWMVQGISDKNDQAARMARDLLGDYGSIPYRAKWARKRVIPFVSWIASNTTRYLNLFRNAYLTGRDVSVARGLERRRVHFGRTSSSYIPVLRSGEPLEQPAVRRRRRRTRH